MVKLVFTPDTGHVTCDTQGVVQVNIVSKVQIRSSNGLEVFMF